MDRPKLTIAIPTYNRCAVLDITIQKVLEQKNDYVEILISDNASMDDTQNVVKQYINQGIVYYRHEKNIGPDKNFLSCMEHANGEYVLLLSDDDCLLPGAVESILECIKLEPVAIHLNSCNILEDGKNNFSLPRFEEQDILCYQDKNEFLEKIGIYITFLSTMVYKTNLVKQILDKEQYIGTYFLQSHIALEVLKNEGNIIVNTHNCVAARGNETLGYDVYHVWGKQYKNLLMETGLKSGFDKNVLGRVMKKSLSTSIINFVLKFRESCKQSSEWMKEDMAETVEPYGCIIRAMYFIAMNVPVKYLRIIRWLVTILRKCRVI